MKLPSPGVIKGVDEEERHGTSGATRGDVGDELGALAGGLGDSEGGLDGVLKGEVKGLGGEVPQHISQVSCEQSNTRIVPVIIHLHLQLTSPEGVDTLCLKHPLSAVNDTGVGLVQTTLLDHLVLILDKELHSLDGGGSSLGDSSSDTSEHEVLSESKLLLIGHLALDIAGTEIVESGEIKVSV